MVVVVVVFWLSYASLTAHYLFNQMPQPFHEKQKLLKKTILRNKMVQPNTQRHIINI